MIFRILILFSIIFPINLDNIILNNKIDDNDNKESIISQNDIDLLLLDEAVDPDVYKVGPGDNLSFNLISSDGSVSLILTISPIGDILIPNIGNININNMFLTDAINKVKVKCKEKYVNAEVFISLYSFRKFNVQLFGPGVNNGYIPVSPLHRLSYVYNEIINNKAIDYSIREIEIIKESEILKYDLLDFFVLGNELSNPYIEQNDKIKFNIRNKTININGGVGIIGVYDYKINETLESLINIAGDFTEDADSNYIEITRFLNDYEYELIVLNDYLKNKDFILKPYDDIRIRRKKEFKRADYIMIDGEVNYPGRYLLSEVSTYKQIIELAGGYTDKADTTQIEVNNEIIQLNKDLELERIKLIPPINRTPSEKSYIIARKKIVKGTIKSNDLSFSNFIKLNTPESGDEIRISKKIDYVEVIGAVSHPGRYNFNKSKLLKSYIEDAGGYSTNASKQRYLIKASDGKRIKLSRNPKIDSGDIIFISSRQDYNSFVRFKEVLQIIGNFAALIAVIESLSN